MRQSTTPRKPLSKRTRFEVFKRDGFTCQYCGKQPPEATLECDHIDPVVAGGTNDMANLTTSCRECNSGKGGVPLGDVRPTPDAEALRLERLQELAELRAYQDAGAAADVALSEVVDQLCQLWVDEFGGHWNSSKTMKTWVKTYGPDDIQDAILKTSAKACDGWSTSDCCRYVGGILRNKKNRRDGRTCDTCVHLFIADGMYGCYQRPADDDGQQYYCVQPKYSCRHWAA